MWLIKINISYSIPIGNKPKMIVLVTGSNGNTATRVVRLLKEKSTLNPVAMIGDTEQCVKFDSIVLTNVLADLEYPIDHAILWCDAIIFAVGSSDRTDKDKTVLVDHIGVIRSMVTGQVQVVKHYIMLNAINADENNTLRIANCHKAEALRRDTCWT